VGRKNVETHLNVSGMDNPFETLADQLETIQMMFRCLHANNIVNRFIMFLNFLQCLFYLSSLCVNIRTIAHKDCLKVVFVKRNMWPVEDI
jgi:hypothetical protein